MSYLRHSEIIPDGNAFSRKRFAAAKLVNDDILPKRCRGL